MKMTSPPTSARNTLALLILSLAAFATPAQLAAIHVWEMHEITLQASGEYANPYKDVTCWVDLKGPGFEKRVYGFWDGGRTFRVRVVATAPGNWTWTSGSNRAADKGLHGKVGSFRAVAWTEPELRENPLRRGFLRPTQNGHALQHADGTPFFLVGDTWLAAATWRLPFTGAAVPAGYEPAPGITFEQAVAYRRRQGYNSISMISAFPNWASDHYPFAFTDSKGVTVRSGWEKFGVVVGNGTPTIKDMHDERGYLAFEWMPRGEALSNFDRIVPEYFQSLDRKIRHLNEQGFIAMLETIRRDITMAWKQYFDFNESFARYVQYISSRYGAFHFIYSKIHLDAIPRNASLTADDFNAALRYHYKKYGPMPFGQPVTTLITASTYKHFGHGDQAPWLTLHAVGNSPRNHGSAPNLEEMFGLEPPYPTINLEPYYTGWNHPVNSPLGESPPAGSERDTYFARLQMYGSVLSGALSGHVHGHGAYDITTTGEPVGRRPYIWEALRYPSGGQMQWLAKFILSEGRKYQDLRLAGDEISPRQAPESKPQGMDGWAYMMRTPLRDLAFLYFEHLALPATISNLKPESPYRFTWYDPRNGEWLPPVSLQTDARGSLRLPEFPDSSGPAKQDWAAKLALVSR